MKNDDLENKGVGIVFITGPANSGKRRFAESILKHGSTNNTRIFNLTYTYQQQLEMNNKLYVQLIFDLAKRNKAAAGDVLLCPVPHWIDI